MTTAMATAIQLTTWGVAPVVARPLYNATIVNIATTRTLMMSEDDDVRFGTAGLNFASVVAVPQRKQMSAFSAISVPHWPQVTDPRIWLSGHLVIWLSGY